MAKGQVNTPPGYVIEDTPKPPQGYVLEDMKKAQTDIAHRQMTHDPVFNSRDPGIDYKSGIQDAGFRAGFSRMDNQKEKSNYLNKIVGENNWGLDSYGAYFIKPDGGKRLGLTFKKPVSLDEQGFSRNDFSDVAGSLPAAVGGIGGAMMASGAGFVPGVITAGVGAIAGETVDEIIKNFQGYHDKTPTEFAKHLTGEGAAAAVGEGIFRPLAGAGKYLLGPQAKRMTPLRESKMKETVEMGFKVKPGQITEGPLLGRWEGMVQQIFGDLNAPHNAKVALRKYDELLVKASTEINTKGEISVELANAIKASRKAFGDKADKFYGVVDDIVGGKPVIPTTNFKKALDDLIEDMPVDKSGKPIFTSPELKSFFNSYSELAEFQTTKAAQKLRTTFREHSTYNDLIPGMDKHVAGKLKRAVNQDMAETNAPMDAIIALREADNFYKEGIKKYDDYVLRNITKAPGTTGSIEPEMVLDYIIKPGYANRIARVKKVIPEKQWEMVKRGQAERILEKTIRASDSPLETEVFDGVLLEKELNKYKDDVLNEVFGKEWTREAHKLASALRIAESRQKLSGGIVAANIALHPVMHLPKLVWLRQVATLMEKPAMLRYMTTGLKIPKTRAGVSALARITAQMTMLAEDQTGSAKATISDPEQIQNVEKSQPMDVNKTMEEVSPLFY